MAEFLGLTEIARLWGVEPGTVRRYWHDGRLPEPDAVIISGSNRRPGWSRETIAAIARPGQGARTDLRRAHNSDARPTAQSRSSRRSKSR